jgi:hypothetical protein
MVKKHVLLLTVCVLGATIVCGIYTVPQNGSVPQNAVPRTEDVIVASAKRFLGNVMGQQVASVEVSRAPTMPTYPASYWQVRVADKNKEAEFNFNEKGRMISYMSRRVQPFTGGKPDNRPRLADDHLVAKTREIMALQGTDQAHLSAPECFPLFLKVGGGQYGVERQVFFKRVTKSGVEYRHERVSSTINSVTGEILSFFNNLSSVVVEDAPQVTAKAALAVATAQVPGSKNTVQPILQVMRHDPMDPATSVLAWVVPMRRVRSDGVVLPNLVLVNARTGGLIRVE